MIEWLYMIPAFLVALGLLVTFHEFGHFYVARRCGVKVLRFSVGFGKSLFTWRDKQGTEYVLAAIPLGGYVKMLDEREGEVAEHEMHRAFTQKNVWQRIAIVVAGPVANFILAVLLFWIILIPGTTNIVPIIGEVQPESIAARAGLEPGQEIVAVDGRPTPTWQRLNQQLLQRLGESGQIDFTARYADSDLVYESSATIDRWLQGDDTPNPIAGLGLTLYRPQVGLDIGVVEAGSPADRAGMEVGDHLSAADGLIINNWQAWVDYVRARPQQTIVLEVLRDQRTVILDLVPQTVVDADGLEIGRVGVGSVRPSWPPEMLRKTEYSVVTAFVRGVEKTWETSHFVLVSVKKLIVGEISTKNLSGPITIAKVAGDSAQAGWSYYLSFLALLSVSLGVFNLLPIPVLDGGHLFYYLVEVVKGSPVPEKIQVVGYQLGLCVVAGIMVLALYNDVMRL